MREPRRCPETKENCGIPKCAGFLCVKREERRHEEAIEREYIAALESVARAVAGYEGDATGVRPSLLWWRQCQAAARNALGKRNVGGKES